VGSTHPGLELISLGLGALLQDWGTPTQTGAQPPGHAGASPEGVELGPGEAGAGGGDQDKHPQHAGQRLLPANHVLDVLACAGGKHRGVAQWRWG